MSERHPSVLIDFADLGASTSQSPECVETSTDRIAATTGSVVRVLRKARRRNATPLLVAILADPTQAEVARQRAFGRINAELQQPHRSASPTVPSDHDAA
jgi:hypothetical protein